MILDEKEHNQKIEVSIPGRGSFFQGRQGEGGPIACVFSETGREFLVSSLHRGVRRVWGVFTLTRFYQPYFNIDSRDIRMRLFCSFLPRKPEFF
jgi:hypothetical protein